MYKQTKASICQLKSRILTAMQVYLYVHLTEEEVVHFVFLEELERSKGKRM